MSQTLTLIISKNRLPDRENRFVFDENGGSIGRNPDNYVVLPDPNHYLSRKHALISYENGAYYLTDTSENGVFLNHSDQPVGKNNSVRLNHGDRVGLNEYELDVSIEQVQPAVAPEQYESGPALFGSESIGSSPEPPPVASPWAPAESPDTAPAILDGSEPSGEVPDYLRGEHRKSDMGIATESDHSAAEQDYFVPPEMKQKEQSLDWDKTGFSTTPAAGSETPDWDRTDFVAPARTEEKGAPGSGSGESTAAHLPERPPAQAGSGPAAGEGPPGGGEAGQARSVPDVRVVEEASAAPPSSSQVQPEGGVADVRAGGYPPAQAPPVSAAPEPEAEKAVRQAGPSASPVGAQAVQAFLEGAGMELEQLTPEAAEALMRLQGKLYREIVQGMMEVLRARFDLKNEFRMRQTQIQTRENNPLKFIGQVDDALEYLVVNKSSGFLGPEAAFREAFHDIKDHQVAMVVGMRAAFNALLQRFDPEQLESRFTKGSKIESLLPMYRKAECWERYQEWYAGIAAAAEDDFQGLFGNEFTRAYEDQMNRLSLLRRKTEE